MAVTKPSNVTAWTVNSLANGANGTSINSVPYTIASNSINTAVDTAMVINRGRMSVSVPLDINGLDVEQVLKDLMQVTGVVARNRQLEAKYKGLKESGERYQLLLQKVQNDVNMKVKEASAEYRFAEEKYKTFETIKDSK